MSMGKLFMQGVEKVANFGGMKGLEEAASKTINRIDSGKGFGESIIAQGKERINQNDKLLAALGRKQGDELSNMDIARSMFYNKQGELQKARVGAGIAGAYMGANMIGHGSLGIPFISSASWNR